MSCKLCNRRKQISLICLKDDLKMCESCAAQHISITDHSKFMMNYLEWFKKQNESETLRLSCTNLIKQQIKSIIDSMPTIHSSVQSSLEVRRDLIKSLIDKAAEEQIKKVSLNRDFAKYSFEKNFHSLYSKNPSSSGLSHIISNLTTESEVDSIKFSEIVYPEKLTEIETHLKANLSIIHQVYQDGKPIIIPYLRPNSSTAYFYDIIHEKTVVKNYFSQVFAMYSAWCFIDHFSLAFSGGCLNGNILFEAFMINPGNFIIEPLPPMIVERYMHGMIWFKGTLYVFGGVSTESNANSIEKLESGSERWKLSGNLCNNKVKMTVCVAGDKIYIGDENNIEVFDPADETCTIISPFKKADFVIMTGIKNSFLLLKKGSLFCVTPEPNFVTRDLGKIPIMEYSNLGQACLVFGKIFFMLDFNKTIYSLNLGDRVLKVVTCLGE